MRRADPVASAAVRAEAESRTQRVADARGSLIRAMRAKDTARVARLLAEDVEILTVWGDTARGRADATRLLVQLATNREYELTLFAGRIEPCVAGNVYEYDGAFTGPPLEGSTAYYAQGYYSIDWHVGDQGVAAQRIRMARRKPHARQPGACQWQYLTAAGQQRLTLTLGLESGNVRPSSTASGVRDAMRTQGMVYAAPTRVHGPAASPFPYIESGFGGLSLGLRYRATPALSTELQVAARRPERVNGLDNAQQRHVTISSSPVTATSLAQYQRGIARFGVGPSIIAPNFRALEEHKTIYIVEPGSHWNVRSDSTWTSRASGLAGGVAGELSLALPMSRQSLVEVKLGIASYGKSRTPETPRFEASRVGTTLASLGIAIGGGW